MRVDPEGVHGKPSWLLDYMFLLYYQDTSDLTMKTGFTKE